MPRISFTVTDAEYVFFQEWCRRKGLRVSAAAKAAFFQNVARYPCKGLKMYSDTTFGETSQIDPSAVQRTGIKS
jgi:hypothetical protein